MEIWRCLITTYRQARKLISGPSPTLKIRLLYCTLQSRVVTGLLSGHSTLSRHSYIMVLFDSPFCRRCGAEEETSDYVLCECGTLTTLRRTNLGFFFLDLKDVRSLSLGAIWNFSRGTGRPWLRHQTMGQKVPVERPRCIAIGNTPT
jgi:hypothetical protein